MPYAIVRLQHIYGPESPAMYTETSHNIQISVSDIIRQIYIYNNTAEEVAITGEPSQYQDFLYIDDAAEAIVKLVNKDFRKMRGHKPIQVGTGIANSLSAVAETVSIIIILVN